MCVCVGLVGGNFATPFVLDGVNIQFGGNQFPFLSFFRSSSRCNLDLTFTYLPPPSRVAACDILTHDETPTRSIRWQKKQSNIPRSLLFAAANRSGLRFVVGAIDTRAPSARPLCSSFPPHLPPLANQTPELNILLHSAAKPDEPGYCLDFILGKASGME